MLALILILSKWLGLLGMVITGVLGLMSPRSGDPLVHYSLGMISTFLFAAAQTMTVYYFVGMTRAVIRAAERLAKEFAGVPVIEETVLHMGDKTAS